MAEKKKILVKDFSLFTETMRSATKWVESAKFMIDQNGLTMYGARSKIARCEIETDSVSSESPISFCVVDLQKFVKNLTVIKDVHQDDYSDFEFTLELPFLKVASKKFKLKMKTDTEEAVEKWVNQKFTAPITPVFEFTTTNQLIRDLSSRSYIHHDTESVRIYLEQKADMEKNSLFASIGNRETELNNEMTLKFGIVTSGAIPADRSIILDLERLNLFNAVASNDIKVTLAQHQCLIGNVRLTGKNDSYSAFKLICSLLVK